MSRRPVRRTELARTGRHAAERRPPTAVRGPWLSALDLQRQAGNRAVSSLVGELRRKETGASRWDPARFTSYGEWLQALPAGAVDYGTVDVTPEVATELPDLAGLVRELRADCADVGILLRHYYLLAHRKNGQIWGRDPKTKERKAYRIGWGVSRRQLRLVLVYIGTIHFQRGQSRRAPLRWYGGRNPLTNLKQILDAGLAPGDILVWKKKAGVKGPFSGHFQTVQRIHRYAPFSLPMLRRRPGSIDVLQGTMDKGKPVGQVQSRRLTFEKLTETPDGDGVVVFEPENEEFFYGAGRWK